MFVPQRLDGHIWHHDSRVSDLKITISGSFHGENWESTKKAVQIAHGNGLNVLSPRPEGMEKVDRKGEFDFLDGDRTRSKKVTQVGHHKAIRDSDLLWIAVANDGYTGLSTAMEIGVAIASGVPVFSKVRLRDDTLREFVQVTRGIGSAVKLIRRRGGPSTHRGAGICSSEEIIRLFEHVAKLVDRDSKLLSDKEAEMIEKARRISEVIHDDLR